MISTPYPYLIAEIGQAHEGSLGILHSYIDALSKTGVNAIKFQMHIAEEETKFGLDQDELTAILTSVELQELSNIKIVGLMGMATFTDNQNQIKKEFQHLKSIFDHAKAQQTTNCYLSKLSMGMSGDYPLAIECGSNMVRVGSSIFGGRK